MKIKFLNASHEAGYVKSRYIRHIGRHLGEAIAEHRPLPWDIVRKMETSRYQQSTRSNDVILAAGDTLRHIVPSPRRRTGRVDFNFAGEGESRAQGDSKVPVRFFSCIVQVRNSLTTSSYPPRQY